MKVNNRQRHFLESVGLEAGAGDARVREFVSGLGAIQMRELEGLAGAGGDGDGVVDESTHGQLRAIARMGGYDDPEAQADGWCLEQIGVDVARSQALEHFRSRRQPTRQHVSVGDGPAERSRSALGDAIAIRLGADLGDEAHPRAAELASMSLVEAARMHFARAGVGLERLTSREKVARAMVDPQYGAQAFGLNPMMVSAAGAMTTSDFPSLLGSGVERSLRRTYMEPPVDWVEWAGRMTVPDFREHKLVAVSNMPTPAKVLEGGEYEHRYFSDIGQTVQVSKYGLITGLTLEALVNDNLGGFVRQIRNFGLAARRLEDDLCYQQITSNPTMDEDSTALFHADHGNLAAGTGNVGAPSLDLISDARVALAGQTDPEGNTLALRPSVLLVPEELYDESWQIVNTLVDPTKQNATPNFESVSTLRVIRNIRLSNNSTTAWYLVADRRMTDTIVMVFQSGAERPTIERQAGFESDVFKWKLRHIVGAVAADYRGLYKNPGA